jgi:hypothetical protein
MNLEVETRSEPSGAVSFHPIPFVTNRGNARAFRSLCKELSFDLATDDNGADNLMSVAEDMSGLGSARSVR